MECIERSLITHICSVQWSLVIWSCALNLLSIHMETYAKSTPTLEQECFDLQSEAWNLPTPPNNINLWNITSFINCLEGVVFFFLLVLALLCELWNYFFIIIFWFSAPFFTLLSIVFVYMIIVNVVELTCLNSL